MKGFIIYAVTKQYYGDKRSGVRWLGSTAKCEKTRTAYKSLVPNLKGIGHQEDLVVDGMVIFKLTLKK
jgi:hypothetical protein